MSMDLNAKAAYIKGLMSGMEYDTNSKEGKIIAAMMELLEEMADTVTEHDNALDQVYDELDTLDEDMDDLAADVYGADDDEDDEDGDAVYEVTCPNCNTVTTVDEDTLLNHQLVCPNCGAAFDIEFETCDGDCDSCEAEDLVDGKTETKPEDHTANGNTHKN